jgi:hypothetical protein
VPIALGAKKNIMNYKDISFKKAEVVQNTDTYNHEMRKSLIDKIFFLDKVDDTSIFVDYGCADGSMLSFASTLIPYASYMGYDLSKEMIDIAKDVNGGSIFFTDDISLLREAIVKEHEKDNKVCISLMSLIHEVYAYGPDSVKKFWEFVFDKELFHYIAIRDMCVSKTTSRPSDPISVAKIRMAYDKNMLTQWESTWGSLNDNWSLTHFLLTYRYVDSWDRELHENYLPLCLEDLMALIPSGWEPTYIEHYTLPFIRRTVKEDFDLDLQDRTHIKLVLKRKS